MAARRKSAKRPSARKRPPASRMKGRTGMSRRGPMSCSCC